LEREERREQQRRLAKLPAQKKCVYLVKEKSTDKATHNKQGKERERRSCWTTH